MFSQFRPTVAKARPAACRSIIDGGRITTERSLHLMANKRKWSLKTTKKQPKFAGDHVGIKDGDDADQSLRRNDSVGPIITALLPEPADHDSFFPPYFASITAHHSKTRATTAEARASESFDWMQVTVDIFTWTNVPRSALSFGVGCSCILWNSLVQDTRYSAINVSAHLGLLCLAAAFFKSTFVNGSTSSSSSSIPTITEADALKLIRLFLPTINALLRKSAELFSGEPTVTLKVAVVLWLLAQAGYRMGLWTLARFAYFALFIAPKCYLSYREQIHEQGGAAAGKFLHLFWTIWDSCGHKKAILFAALALAWNLSSLSTLMFGGFICLVTLRARQQLQRDEPQTSYS